MKTNSIPLSDAECAAHWQTMRAAAIAWGCSPDDAGDAVQELFLILIETGKIATLPDFAPPQQRAFLAQRLRWHLVNQWRNRNTMRRGRGFTHVALDEALEMGGDDTPATLLDRANVLAVLAEHGFNEENLLPETPLKGSQRATFYRRRKVAAPLIAALLA